MDRFFFFFAFDFAKNFGNFSISFERERFLQFNFLRVYILKWKFFEIVSGIRAFSIVRRIIIRVYYLRRNLPDDKFDTNSIQQKIRCPHFQPDRLFASSTAFLRDHR